MFEYSLTIKNEHSKLIEKGISYDTIPLEPTNPWIAAITKEALAKFRATSSATTPTDIIFKTTMIIDPLDPIYSFD